MTMRDWARGWKQLLALAAVAVIICWVRAGSLSVALFDIAAFAKDWMPRVTIACLVGIPATVFAKEIRPAIWTLIFVTTHFLLLGLIMVSMHDALVTWGSWSLLALLLGVIGIIPLAMIALALNGYWTEFWWLAAFGFVIAALNGIGARYAIVRVQSSSVGPWGAAQ
jgi:hypothetical protein